MVEKDTAMEDLIGVIKYSLLVAIPGLAAKELYVSGHPILAILLCIYGFCFFLSIYDKK